MIPRQDEPYTVDTLTEVHREELRALDANPRHVLQPIRRKLFKRLDLISPLEPPRPGVDRRSRPPVRAHKLTPLGKQAAGLPAIVEVAS
jgi:hypothetical protein